MFKSRIALKVTTKLKDVPSYSYGELCPYDFSGRCLFRDNRFVYLLGLSPRNDCSILSRGTI